MLSILTSPIFVELACDEQDIVVTMTMVYVRAFDHACFCPSEFVRTITSTVVDGF